MGLFDSKQKKESKTLIVSLLSVLAADGKIEQEELKLLQNVAYKNNISQKEVEDILKNPGKVSFKIPTDIETKSNHIQEILMMIACDGDISPKELVILFILAKEYKFQFEKLVEILIKFAAENNITYDGKKIQEADFSKLKY